MRSSTSTCRRSERSEAPPLDRKPPDLKAPLSKDRAKRAALNALKRARRAAAKAGVELSDWEGEFLGSIEDRLKIYGRAFGDPEKGGRGQALSVLQNVKLKEIAGKAKAKADGKPPRRPFGRKPKA